MKTKLVGVSTTTGLVFRETAFSRPTFIYIYVENTGNNDLIVTSSVAAGMKTHENVNKCKTFERAKKDAVEVDNDENKAAHMS